MHSFIIFMTITQRFIEYLRVEEEAYVISAKRMNHNSSHEKEKK